MTDNDDKPDIQNSGISNESEMAIQNVAPTEDKTLLHSDAVTDEGIDEPTRRFAASPDQVPTNQPTGLETEPTKILLDEAQDEDLVEDEPNENVLSPNSLRFTLVCFLFVLIIGTNIINFSQQFAIKSRISEWQSVWQGKPTIFQVDPNFADQIRVNDEIVSLNNQPIDKKNCFKIFIAMKAGEQYTLHLKGKDDENLREVKLVTHSLSIDNLFFLYLCKVLVPLVFVLTGLFVFLLNSNNKQALLMSVLLLFLSNFSSSLRTTELPMFFTFWWIAGMVVSGLSLPLMSHLFLVFPERSRLVHHLPILAWLIYLPVLPGIVQRGLELFSSEGLTQFDFILEFTTLNTINVLLAFSSLFLALTLIIFNYLKTDKIGKRQIRLIVTGFTLAFTPLFLFVIVVFLSDFLFDKDLLTSLTANLGDWIQIIINVPFILIPLTCAYAVVQHKVIPFSFVIRRGF